MTKKKSTKIDSDKESGYNVDDDIVPEEDSFGASGKLKKVQKKLKECEKERQEYLNGWQRSRADAVNQNKETALERERVISRAEVNIFKELFPILDSFDMAFSNKEAWEKVDKDWRVGIERIHAQVNRILEQAGISVIDTIGVFNAHTHEPVKIEKVEKKENDNCILTVIQKGYCMGDHVLRPAKVIIGKFK